MFVIIYALLFFVQESQILQICNNVEHFSDLLFHILICTKVINLKVLRKLMVTNPDEIHKRSTL